jgi:solute carrier family 25 (mitochondrial carnitine/acylcarnitine transporter), member 20/29
MDFFAGFLSGIAQVLTGHPFDTMKIWSQNNKNIKINKSLYRGIYYPLLTNSIIVSANFGIYNLVYNKINIKNDEKQIQSIFIPGAYFISGAAAGISTNFLVTPVDFYKINAQMRTNKLIKLNSFPNFPLTSIYRGFTISLLREGLGYATYFHTYFTLRDYEYNSFLSGGIAGIFCWMFTYPLDVIKTRVQSGSANNIICAFQQGNLFRGIQYSLVRAFIANSVGFYVYDAVKNLKK